jgi:hypothetical protein
MSRDRIAFEAKTPASTVSDGVAKAGARHG